VHNAQHRHGIVIRTVPIDHDVGRDNADADVGAESGTWRSTARMIGKAFIEFFEKPIVFDGDAVSASALGVIIIRAISP
jgi:hypothetical protein